MSERVFKMYSPLTGELYQAGEYEYEDSVDEYNGEELLPYAEEIEKAVKAYTDDGTENLMKYFDGSDFIKRHVLSAVPSVEIRDGQLYGCTTVQVDEDLSELGWNQLMDYLSGQYADGWGEGFEQRDISVADGVLNVHFWQPDQRCPIVLDTLPSQEPTVPRQAHKPKMKLIGQDGNIFSVLGRAGRLLRQHGQRKQAEEMFQRVQNCGDYNKALGIISEYVQTELPAPEKGDAAPRPPKNSRRGDEDVCFQL